MKTNREHFSWSQYNLWHTSKREFWKRYHLGSEQRTNRFFDKGKELASFAETGEIIGDDPMLLLVVEQLPKFGIAEQELNFFVDTKIGLKDILCYVDSGSEDGANFAEYKTGKIAWTQDLADEHEQLLFYALAYYKKHGAIPKSTLVWVETMETKEDGLLYTGNVQQFKREFTLKELNAFEKKIAKTIEEIDGYEYQELELEETDVERYARLQEIIEEASLEMASIKMKIQGQMMINDVTFGKGIRGNFIISERKNWDYSEYIDEMKKDITKQQKIEQKNGTAKFSTSKSIMFKLNK